MNLSDTKNFQDKINNELKEKIQTIEFINNTCMFHAIRLLKNLTKIISIPDTIYVFYYNKKQKDTDNPNYYIPVYTCKVALNKTTSIDNFIYVNREDFYNQIPFNHKVVLLARN